MGLTDLETIPDSGAVFTVGRSRFADNVASHFFIRKDPVVSITCGDEHSAVICQNGRLFVFGSNDWGQLGLGHRNHVSKPSCVKILKPEKVTHVACGRAHTLICTGAQKIFACGSDQEGQLGRGTSAIGDSASSPVLVYDSGLVGPKVVQIAAGSHHSLALTGDGGVFAWGSNLEGQLGLPDVSGLVNKPTKVHIPEPVKQISAGYYHSAFLTESGLVYVCGESESGKLGIDVNFSTQVTPKQMQLLTSAMHVACGGHHTIILAENGNLYCTGSNSNGQLGLGTNVTELHTPKLLPRGALQNETIIRIACGESHTAIVTASGKLFTCGDGRHGKLGLEENENNVHELTFAPRYKELAVSNVACGGCHTILIAHKRKMNGTMEEETETQMEHVQKRNLPPLKLPVNRLQSENHEDTVNGKEKEQSHRENNVTETISATTPPATTETILQNTKSSQESITNNITHSMDDANKIDSSRETPEMTPKEMPPEVKSNEISEVISKEAPPSMDHEPKDSNTENKNKETENDNEKSSIEMDAENNVQEMEKPEIMNSEQDMGENNNETVKESTVKESTVNNVEADEQTSEKNGAMGTEENEDNKDDTSKSNNLEMKSENNNQQEMSPAKQVSPSGSTPPPKPPRLKPGSGSNSPTERAQSIKEEDQNGDVTLIKEETTAKESETIGEKESTQNHEPSETIALMKSRSSRSIRSRVDTEGMIEIDKTSDKEKVIEQRNVNNDHTLDDADVVQSPPPRTGKMSKMFKSKKHQATENGTKATNTVNNKSKSKTCSIL